MCEALLKKGSHVVCMDNFATGKKENIHSFLSNSAFSFIEGDIQNLSDCQQAVEGVDYVLHQAALGSVPRSIKDPISSNDVNVGGFLNMLIVSRDANDSFMQRVPQPMEILKPYQRLKIPLASPYLLMPLPNMSMNCMQMFFQKRMDWKPLDSGISMCLGENRTLTEPMLL